MNEMRDDDTYVALLKRRATVSPERRAFYFIDRNGSETARLTYGELHERARAVASAISQLCAVGARAIIALPTGPEFIVAFFGCLGAGVIAVPAPSIHPRSAVRFRAMMR